MLFVFIATSVMAATPLDTNQLYHEGQSESGQWGRPSSDLQQKINTLNSTANPYVYMPVLFGVAIKDISPNFCDPRYGGRTHEGEDIMAVKGTPIVSPTPAVVLRTGVGETEGNYVYTANPGGETFVYMHLDRIGEGVISGLVLAQGSLIGYIGNTGNASGGAAHLHFEIHNSSGIPIDPFPRLTGEFSLQEKISYLSTILTQTSDSALPQFLVSNFRATFVSALVLNITLPASIINFLVSIPETPTPTGSLPAEDLDIGSSGIKVVELQRYLIQTASGTAATRLASAGATGYFGAITRAALMEYQTSMRISPSNGYYGSATREFITAHPLTSQNNPTSVTFTRNLYLGISGEDVRTLQKLLNANGYTVAITSYGSAGNETTYFGPATKAAVIKFQITKGISPVAGYVGPITRLALLSL